MTTQLSPAMRKALAQAATAQVILRSPPDAPFGYGYEWGIMLEGGAFIVPRTNTMRALAARGFLAHFATDETRHREEWQVTPEGLTALEAGAEVEA